MITPFRYLGCLLLLNLNLLVYAAEDKIYSFDFGPTESDWAEGYIGISEKTSYTKKQGFGLVTRGATPVLYVGSLLLDPVESDGLESESVIQFRVDIPPGAYWVEFIIPAGKRSSWTGQVLINNQLVAGQIHQYETNVEADSPPVSWMTSVEFNNEQSYMQVELLADNQITALSGLRIFPKEMGPLILNDGMLRSAEELRAPNSEFIVELLNRGAVDEVRKLIDAIPEESFRFEKALFLVALAGRLETEHPRSLLEWARKLLQDQLAKAYCPSNTLN
jgi:hypothetical protein